MTKRQTPPIGETEQKIRTVLSQVARERGRYPISVSLPPMQRLALPPAYWFRLPVADQAVEILSSPEVQEITLHWPPAEGKNTNEEEEERRPVCD